MTAADHRQAVYQRPSLGRPRRVLVWLGLAVIVLLIASQPLLPRLAAAHIRSSLQDARGVSVSVSALPALELIFGHADTITIHAREMRIAERGTVTSLLDRAAGVHRLDVSVDLMYVAGLALEHVSLTKMGSAVSATATVTREAIAEVLPASITLRGTQESARVLRVDIAASLFGQRVSPVPS